MDQGSINNEYTWMVTKFSCLNIHTISAENDMEIYTLNNLCTNLIRNKYKKRNDTELCNGNMYIRSWEINMFYLKINNDFNKYYDSRVQ